MQTILIVGLGIGSMYKKILTSNHGSFMYNVITIDSNPAKKADYQSLDECLKDRKRFDMAIICTPNYVHEEYVDKLVDICRVVLVEKPGLVDSATWSKYFNRHKNLFLIKNNMFRKNIDDISEYILSNFKYIESVRINWVSQNRVPNPGTWFTTKKLAWGGVSRDLVPHLLSMYYEIFRELDFPEHVDKEKRHTLLDIASTEYGSINRDGIYDVDDYCRMVYSPEFFKLEMVADWKNDKFDTEKHPDGLNIGIDIELKKNSNLPNGSTIHYDFGLCPESVYVRMIDFFLDIEEENVMEQYEIDMWIHKNLEQLEHAS